MDTREEGANIVLTGFMGTGKTTVGRILAQNLRRPFLDMDALIEERAGRSIASIFESDGEACFRKLERELVGELSARRGLAIATGGGIVLNPLNVRDFEATGLLICLDASPAAILRRVLGETQRPLLAGGDKAGRIRDLMAARSAAYAAVRIHVDTDGLTPEEVAAAIMRRFRRNPG